MRLHLLIIISINCTFVEDVNFIVCWENTRADYIRDVSCTFADEIKVFSLLHPIDRRSFALTRRKPHVPKRYTRVVAYERKMPKSIERFVDVHLGDCHERQHEEEPHELSLQLEVVLNPRPIFQKWIILQSIITGFKISMWENYNILDNWGGLLQFSVHSC